MIKGGERATSIQLESIDLSAMTGLQRIVALHTHTLLAYRCDSGILLHDRRSGQQHLLPWEKLRAMLLCTPLEEDYS